MAATASAFAALTSLGDVVVWGDAAEGGAVDAAARARLHAAPARRLVATRGAFAALLVSGEVRGVKGVMGVFRRP